MATPSELLRLAIQAAGPSDTITLDPNDSPFSVVTLAKIECSTPITGAAGYTIDGAGSVIEDTRIYQNNIDGPAPGTVTNLTLNYTSAAANTTAILRATKGTYNISNSEFNGTHSGWAGNGGVYMSLNSQTPNNNSTPPSTAQLNLTNVNVNVTGQAGFTGTTGSSGGTAFLQSWNNSGGVKIMNGNFDESGYRNSFHFATFSNTATPPTTANLLGTYEITNTTFFRADLTKQTRRSRGNVLESVKATLGAVVFNDGAFLDISGRADSVKFASMTQNYFDTIDGGFGIRLSETSPSGQTLTGLPDTTGAFLNFTGPGLALKYVNPNNGQSKTLTGGSFNINGSGFSTLTAGGQGNDTLTGDAASNWMSGDAGNDNINGADGADYLLGGEGDDTINGGAGTSSGNDTIDGGNGNDSLSGGDGNDSILGGDGNDTLIGGAGSDHLSGGAGIDTLSYSTSSLGQTVNLATNTASGGQAAGDVISGFENLIGGSSVDNLTGDDNANFIDGGSSGDTINGGLGDDTLLGSAGNDTLIGGGGNDRIDGGSQNDSIIGGDGMDTLTGGANNDSFVYNSPTEGQDVITDFAVSGTSQDSFRFRSAAFGGIAVGTLTSANFNSTSNPTFLYNGVSGVLSYDSDGTNGPNAAVNIATLQGTPALTEARITIF